jgi:hypothetical protein
MPQKATNEHDIRSQKHRNANTSQPNNQPPALQELLHRKKAALPVLWHLIDITE